MAEDVPLSSPPPLIPFLPDEISFLCIARVPVTSHTAISHVSRSWRSFVRSSSFFSVRSEIAVTELVLTVCIFDYSGGGGRNRWYHLHPYKTPFPLPIPQQDYNETTLTCASIGPHLFCISKISSHNPLQIYDGCLRRWSHGPPTSESWGSASAGVAGGRIHVIHHYKVSPLAESLDPTRIRWDPVPTVPAHVVGNCWWWYGSGTAIDGKLLVRGRDDGGQHIGATFDPDAEEWAHAPPWSMENVPLDRMAVVGGVPYVFLNQIEGIVAYGSDEQRRSVKGESVAELINRITKYDDDVRLLTFGGLLCLAGQERETKYGSIVSIFAGIDISRTADGGFRGSIMWLDSSLKHSNVGGIRHCVVMEL